MTLSSAWRHHWLQQWELLMFCGWSAQDKPHDDASPKPIVSRPVSPEAGARASRMEGTPPPHFGDTSRLCGPQGCVGMAGCLPCSWGGTWGLHCALIWVATQKGDIAKAGGVQTAAISSLPSSGLGYLVSLCSPSLPVGRAGMCGGEAVYTVLMTLRATSAGVREP